PPAPHAWAPPPSRQAPLCGAGRRNSGLSFPTGWDQGPWGSEWLGGGRPHCSGLGAGPGAGAGPALTSARRAGSDGSGAEAAAGAEPPEAAPSGRVRPRAGRGRGRFSRCHVLPGAPAGLPLSSPPSTIPFPPFPFHPSFPILPWAPPSPSIHPFHPIPCCPPLCPSTSTIQFPPICPLAPDLPGPPPWPFPHLGTPAPFSVRPRPSGGRPWFLLGGDERERLWAELLRTVSPELTLDHEVPPLPAFPGQEPRCGPEPTEAFTVGPKTFSWTPFPPDLWSPGRSYRLLRGAGGHLESPARSLPQRPAPDPCRAPRVEQQPSVEGAALRRCPMCQKEFGPRLTQLDVDSHLAQCLAESTEDVMW
uniref:UBZ2-type domain-containing protein n=1 Tax=Papio anubis TaxID=9555 RepID=A0A8I5NAM6_PAPAN